jgi:hypothetical protein
MLGLRGADQLPTIPFDSVPNVDLSAVKGSVRKFTGRMGLNTGRWGSRNNFQGFSGDGISRSGFSRLPSSHEEAAHMLGEDEDEEDIESQIQIVRPPGMDSEGNVRL